MLAVLTTTQQVLFQLAVAILPHPSGLQDLAAFTGKWMGQPPLLWSPPGQVYACHVKLSHPSLPHQKLPLSSRGRLAPSHLL